MSRSDLSLFARSDFIEIEKIGSDAALVHIRALTKVLDKIVVPVFLGGLVRSEKAAVFQKFAWIVHTATSLLKFSTTL